MRDPGENSLNVACLAFPVYGREFDDDNDGDFTFRHIEQREILVPRQEMEPVLPEVEAWS